MPQQYFLSFILAITVSQIEQYCLILKCWTYIFKSFCLRDRGRLGNEGQPILLTIGTQSRYVDLCNMPKF